jgi:hypothetical protein
MGWVVYDDQYRLVKYYKKPGPARAAVTRYRNEMAQGYRSYPRILGCCTYRDFEGILMGLRGDALKMWLFCNTKNG